MLLNKTKNYQIGLIFLLIYMYMITHLLMDFVFSVRKRIQNDFQKVKYW